jgi:putative PIN family toxin of toxin-antitoxin system
LLAELLDVLSREKFAQRLSAAGSSAQSVVAELRRLAYMVAPLTVPRVIEHDADDDHVLARALAGQVNMIVSGDRHLLSLGGLYQGIPIVTAARAVQRISGINSSLAP